MKNTTDSKSEFIAAVAATLKFIGLSETFFHGLFQQGDDWTFVIKTHALLESAITHLLVTDLDRAELAPLLSNLEMSNTRVGKVAFAKALGLLDKDYRRFVRNLSELRNELVHDIRNTAFAFECDHADGLKKIVRKCVETSALMLKEEIAVGDKKVTREKFSVENPRLTIWIAVHSILDSIYHAVGMEDPLLRALIKHERRKQPNQTFNTGPTTNLPAG